MISHRAGATPQPQPLHLPKSSVELLPSAPFERPVMSAFSPVLCFRLFFCLFQPSPLMLKPRIRKHLLPRRSLSRRIVVSRLL